MQVNKPTKDRLFRSGYGQDGHPDYVTRASYDFTGQAFGGMMNLLGFPDPEPPVRAVPHTADYITAYVASM